jgi:CRISPR-associated protein Csh1
MQQSILSLIRLDKEMKNDHAIRKKMDIWFSLYYYFEHSNQRTINMINKTKETLDYLKQAVSSENQAVIRNDDDFAFAAGQLIRYLLQQSRSAQRTHALLEPFLQKVKPEEFKHAIANAFATYKHEIKLYSGSKRYPFERLMSEVMGYTTDAQNIKTLIPMILAGYFAPSILFTEEFASANKEETSEEA